MAVIVPAAIGAVELGYGIVKSGEAKRAARKLAQQRPTYNIPSSAKDESALANSELANGMSAEAKQAYENDLDRGASSSIGAIERLGGGPNNIAAVYDGSAQGRAKLAEMKENLRLNQVNNAVNASRNMQEQEDKQFQINQYAPYVDQVQATAAERQQAANIEASGVSAIGSAFGSAAAQKKLGSALTPKTAPTTQPATPSTSSVAPSNGFSGGGAGGSWGNSTSALDVNGTSDDNIFSTINTTMGE
jgi:hypothetical protein